MSLFVGVAIAALFATLPGGAPRAMVNTAPVKTAPAVMETDSAPRVEIGPAVLIIYDANGKVVSVE